MKFSHRIAGALLAFFLFIGTAAPAAYAADRQINTGYTSHFVTSIN